MSKLFEDDKENCDPNTACGVVRRNSVRRKATTESPKPVLIEKKKTGMEQGLVVCVTNDWTGSVIGILYVCECGTFYVRLVYLLIAVAGYRLLPFPYFH